MQPKDIPPGVYVMELGEDGKPDFTTARPGNLATFERIMYARAAAAMSLPVEAVPKIDVWRQYASELFHVAYDDVTREQYFRAKGRGYSGVYAVPREGKS